MKASEFMAQHDIGYSVVPLDKPDDLTGHPWFLVRFMLPARHSSRVVDLEFSGAADDDVSSIGENITEVFYRMADAARYGESYEELLSDYGTNLSLTREQWEHGQKALRERCQAWLPNPQMWKEFLSVEIDDDGTTA